MSRRVAKMVLHKLFLVTFLIKNQRKQLRGKGFKPHHTQIHTKALSRCTKKESQQE